MAPQMQANPFESPRTETAPRLANGRPPACWSLLLLPLIGIVAGVLIGALTNTLNGAVCPEYFTRVMGWPATAPIGVWSVRQGMLEGGLCGFFFALVLSIVMALRSRLRCPFRRALGYFVVACLGVVLCTILGGVVGAGWAASDPASYLAAFPTAISPGTARFAWVGGSIWGGQLGGLAMIVLTSIVFCVRCSTTGSESPKRART